MVTSKRSISDFDQTVSCDRLPHRIAARMERSRFSCSTRTESAALNSFSTLAVVPTARCVLAMHPIVAILLLTSALPRGAVEALRLKRRVNACLLNVRIARFPGYLTGTGFASAVSRPADGPFLVKLT